MIPYGKGIRRPLQAASPNLPRKKRTLNIKRALTSDAEISAICSLPRVGPIMQHSKAHSKLQIYKDKSIECSNNIDDVDVDADAASEIVYTSAASKKLHEDVTLYELNKKNLGLRQAEIYKFETMEPSCNHFLCHRWPSNSVLGSRVWFLFELEMTTDGVSNLRDACYFNRIYKRIIPGWEVANSLAAAVPRGYEAMPIEYLQIPSLQRSPIETSHGKDVSIDDVSIQFHTIVEEPEKPTRRIPPTSLRSRYNSKTFEDIPIDVASILNESNGGPAVQDTNRLQTGKPKRNRGIRMRSYFLQD